MIEMITDPIFDATGGVVCFVSDTVAGLTGVRCAYEAPAVTQQAVRRQQVVAASQPQTLAPQRAGFATNFIARG